MAAAYSDIYRLDLLASDPARAHLVAVCRRAENAIAGAPTGGLDQSASLLCREAHALLLDCRDGHTEHVPVDLAGAGLAVLVIDSRARHELVDGQYGARRAACESAATILGVETLREVPLHSLDEAMHRLPDVEMRHRVRHVVTEIGRVADAVRALRSGEFDRVGKLFTASQASLRDDYEVSCPELDLAVAAAERAGALGARMTGGGFGGSAIALVPEDSANATAAAVRAAFDERGFTEPNCFPVVPSAGARRDE